MLLSKKRKAIVLYNPKTGSVSLHDLLKTATDLDVSNKQDLYKINHETHDRRKQNAECFFNGTFGNKYYQELLSCINKLN